MARGAHSPPRNVPIDPRKRRDVSTLSQHHDLPSRRLSQHPPTFNATNNVPTTASTCAQINRRAAGLLAPPPIEAKEPSTYYEELPTKAQRTPPPLATAPEIRPQFPIGAPPMSMLPPMTVPPPMQQPPASFK